MTTTKHAFLKAGWGISYMGGGNLCYGISMPDKKYFLATGPEGIDFPNDLDNILVGYYQDWGESITNPSVMTWSQLCEMIESYKQLMDGMSKGFNYESQDN